MSQTASLTPPPLMSSGVSYPAVEHTAAIVAAYVSHNPVSQDRLPDLIKSVYGAVDAMFSPSATVSEPEALTPAVPIKKSITADYIVCLDDGLKFKSLKRHLHSLGMTPDEYRQKWGLPADYPMVCPNYSEQRSSLAKKHGLGLKH